MAKSLDKSDAKKDRTERTDKEGRDGGTATAEKTHPNQPPSHARAADDRPPARPGPRFGPLPRRPADRKAVRQGLGHEARRRHSPADRGHPHRLALARHRPRRRRHPPRPRHRDLRPRIQRQDHARAARHRQRPEGRRRRRVHRRRARPRPLLGQAARRRARRPAGQPARHRRAGAGDLRDARPLQRGRRDRHRLGRRPRSRGRKSKARWATPTSACRPG